MRKIALLLPVGLLLAGCPGPARKLPESGEPAVLRIARPDDRALAERLEASAAGVDGIVWVAKDQGAEDVAVVYGLSQPPAGMVATRIPTWDRSWFLEVDTLARWVDDPTFRRWLAARIDRAGMARVLFGDGAEPILSGLPEAGRRPVSSGARPRLRIARQAGDPTAERIVSRLRADLLPDRVLLEPSAVTPDRVIALRLLDHDPAHAGPEPDTVIPLVRQRAYLLTRAGLSGIIAGPTGILTLGEARWKR